ncbi:MAG: DUF4160 domain-containing protein [Acidobacteria bacterium]|nr:DUF4160 domain-containing protein [Acidobacteriota bacterium]
MFAESETPHHTAHFHAYYQEHVAIYGIDPLERFSNRCSASGTSRDRPPGLSSEGQARMPALLGRHTATGELL